MPSAASTSRSHSPSGAEAVPGAVWGLTLGFAGLFAAQAWARVDSLHNRTFDLAEYARIAWGLAHGDFWDPIVDVSFWGGHLAFVLWPLGLLGRLFGCVPVLLVAQALCIALAALPLARVGARRLGRHGALWAAASYLLYPNLGHVASYEFHPGNLALLPLALALDALDRGAPRALCGWAIAMWLCRADLALCTLMLGLCALWLPARRAALRGAGVGLVLGSLGYAALALSVQAVHARADGSAALHFGIWGGSPLGVWTALFHEPTRVLAHFAAPERLRYVPLILLPVAGFSLLAPRHALAALPFVAINLLSGFPTTTWLDSHYLTAAVPVLVFAALHGALRVRRMWRVLVPLAALGGSVVAGGLPWSIDRDADAFARGPEYAAERALLDAIPARASVQAPDRLLPHLAERVRVYRAPPPERGTEFVVLDLSHRQRFADTETLLRTSEEPFVRSLLARGDHAPLARAPGLLLLRRGASPRTGLGGAYLAAPQSARDQAPAAPVKLCACLALERARLVEDGVELVLQARAACPNDLALRLGAAPRPELVQLPFDGVLSPAQLRPGDRLRSLHALPVPVRAAIAARGLRVGALRSSGAPPERGDPVSVAVPLVDTP